MAHHHRASNQPHDAGMGLEDIMVSSTAAKAPNPNHSSREIEKVQAPAQRKKSIFDYEIAGIAWPMVALMCIMVTALLVVVLKIVGIF